MYGIYANIGGILMVNVIIYIAYMDPMGNVQNQVGMVHDFGSPIGDCQPIIYIRNMSLHPKKFAGHYCKTPESLPPAKQAEIASTRQYAIRIHQIPQ